MAGTDVAAGSLSGRRVLVVEDTFLIADHISDLLSQEGCEVLGPVGRVASALDFIRSAGAIHGALLDINLDGQLCFPVAEALAGRRVPFIFLTGYDARTVIPAAFADRPVLSKPVDEAGLVAAAVATFGKPAKQGHLTR